MTPDFFFYLLRASQAIFSGELRKGVDNLAITLSPEIKELVLSNIKAVFQLPEAEKSLVLQAYMQGVTHIFLMGVPTCALASLAALLITRERMTLPATP